MQGAIGGGAGYEPISPYGKHANLAMGSAAELNQLADGRANVQLGQMQIAMSAAEAGTLLDLLGACEAADMDRGGRLHGAQLLTCCRMQGIPESSSMLRAMIDDSQGTDGRVEYVAFVQQLAAQRASGAARANVAQAVAQAAYSHQSQ